MTVVLIYHSNIICDCQCVINGSLYLFPAPNKVTKRQGEELSAKAKWKRATFDPAQLMTVSKMTEELANRQASAQKGMLNLFYP